MRKSLLALSLMLATGSAALMLSGGASAQPSAASRTAGTPIMLAQLNVTPERPRDDRVRRRTPPSAEQLAQRRAELCKEGPARAAGHLAYLETRLELTANQRAAFGKWRDVRLAAAGRQAQNCAARTSRADRGAAQAQTRPGPAERLARQEQMLRQRLADITAERPALEALTNSLTAAQRRTFDTAQQPRSGFGHASMRARHAMAGNRAGGPRGPMGGKPPAPAQP